MNIAELVVLSMQIWGAIGALVALPFLIFGVDRIDEDAQGAYIFRVLLVPGVLLIWPLVAWRWWQIEAEALPWRARYRPVRAAHGTAALAMTIFITVVLILGLSARQDWPDHIAPQQLTEATE